MPHFEVKKDWVAHTVSKASTVKNDSSKIVSTKKYHSVVKGDTVSGIAKMYGSAITQIKKLNKLDDDYKIRIGQKLHIK